MAKGETLWEACERCAKEVATWPAWMKGGPNYRVIEEEEIAMSNGSKEQELPPLDVTDAERAKGKEVILSDSDYSESDYRNAYAILGSWFYCRERQLRSALAQIANLAAQVEELNGNYTAMKEFEETWRERAESAEAELANECAATPECEERDDWAVRALKAEAELAALREGATVRYRVDTQKGYEFNFTDEDSAREKHSKVPEWLRPASLVEIITRERILDTTGGEG